MKLVIVESPNKIKKIQEFLGSDFTIKASVGHVRDLPKSNKKAIDIEKGFVPTYEVDSKKAHIISDLSKLSKKANIVYLATDPDREGEAISWHLKESLGLKDSYERITFTSITKEAVEDALAHPRKIDMNLVRAQEARRVLDRLVGYDLSGIIWKKVRYGLSAGRVQSPALRIIMEREREIRAFIPEKFYKITGEFTHGKVPLTLECSVVPTEKSEAERIKISGEKEKSWKVVAVEEAEVKRSPKAPFTTSTLQQSASSFLGYSPKKTMMIAQKLYEKGLITYMRTDSPTLSKEALHDIATTIKKTYGEENLEIRVFKSKSKNAQEAHEAIRPTHAYERFAGTTSEEKSLYKLIWSRTIASQMKDAKILRTKVIANKTDAGSDIPDFSINGSLILSPGWMAVDPELDTEENKLPLIKKGDTLSLLEIINEEKETQPPSRYSEAGLVKELDKREIGRPSTYAAIISTLEERGYVTKLNKTLYPTDTGEVVSSFLENYFGSYISDSFTAEMESELDEIAEGKRTYEKTLGDFYSPFLKEVKEKESLAKATDLGDAEAHHTCPLCGKAMKIKLAKTGKFLSCSDYPTCKGARKLDGELLEGPKDMGRPCPKCGKSNLFEREGRFGKFIACGSYPKCKYIEKSPEEEAKGKTGVKCIKCKDGEITERRGRFGPFFSCSNYPDCKAIIKTRPTGNLCPHFREDKNAVCGELMMTGTKTIPERCSDKTCPNHNPHKLK